MRVILLLLGFLACAQARPDEKEVSLLKRLLAEMLERDVRDEYLTTPPATDESSPGVTDEGPDIGSSENEASSESGGSTPQNPSVMCNDIPTSTTPINQGSHCQSRKKRSVDRNNLLSLIERIIGGKVAVPNVYNWMVAMMHRNPTDNTYTVHSCGAALITPLWIITAAHCFFDENNQPDNNPNDWKFRFGEHDLEDNYDGIVRSAAKIILHCNYNGGHNADHIMHDIALVKLDSAVPLSNQVMTVCLPTSDPAVEFNGKKGTVIGWGKTSNDGDSVPKLREVDVVVSNRNEPACAAKNDIKYTLCAADTGKDSCEGDSGGPLVCHNGQKYFLCGVVSHGTSHTCAAQGEFGVYANPYIYRDWIRDVINSN